MDRWRLPEVNGGGVKVPLAKLREIVAEEESRRAFSANPLPTER